MEKVQTPIYNAKGESIGTQDLNPGVFNVAFNDAVVQQVVVAQQANARQVLAHTKGRGEVRGGGKKPWKQKGTGRARHGSTRSPIWVGGGITFGPTKERNFTLKVNKKMRQQAEKIIDQLKGVEKAHKKTLVDHAIDFPLKTAQDVVGTILGTPPPAPDPSLATSVLTPPPPVSMPDPWCRS